MISSSTPTVVSVVRRPKTIEALGNRHDCLEIVYHGGDKLFLPVENIELLTRYGSAPRACSSTGSAGPPGSPARRV
ncbi:MAG: hypothetical protein R3E48_23150 [Burkholderiaceae bacterium]